jgi:hypothetical protein
MNKNILYSCLTTLGIGILMYLFSEPWTKWSLLSYFLLIIWTIWTTLTLYLWNKEISFNRNILLSWIAILVTWIMIFLSSESWTKWSLLSYFLLIIWVIWTTLAFYLWNKEINFNRNILFSWIAILVIWIMIFLSSEGWIKWSLLSYFLFLIWIVLCGASYYLWDKDIKNLFK